MNGTGVLERRLRLDELVSGLDLAGVLPGLEALAGAPLALLDEAGGTVAGWCPDGAPRVPVHWDLEPVGAVAGEAPEAVLRACARVLEGLLHAGARYRLASEMHEAVSRADYEALRASEARYRELAAHLEERVAQQVRTIETQQRQLYQREKQASVGQLAAGLAHEINNPIGFVRSNLATAREYVAELGRFREALAGASDVEAARAAWRSAGLDEALADFDDLMVESIEGVDRVARIVAALKVFSAVDGAEEEDAALDPMLEAVCTVVRPQLAAGVELVMWPGAPPPVRCRPGLLSQVFFNLVLNAGQAVGERGRVEVATGADGDGVWVRVADDGPGIPDEIRDRIFDPFFTTRPVGQGTGLGLSVALDIVRAHGGTIEVESAPGKGAVFTVRLLRRA